MHPSHIGRYRVLSLIGAGGMGQVFLAEDTDLGRRVAIKVLLPDLTGGSDRSRRFTQEARLASAVSHPNIAQIFEIGEADGVAFIVMEFVEGESLSARLQNGPLDCAIPARRRASISRPSFGAVTVMFGTASMYAMSYRPACVSPSSPTRPARSMANTTGSDWMAQS